MGQCRTNLFQTPDGKESTLATGHQDDNKNTDQVSILCIASPVKNFKNIFFSYETFANTIAEMSRRWTSLDRNILHSVPQSAKTTIEHHLQI